MLKNVIDKKIVKKTILNNKINKKNSKIKIDRLLWQARCHLLFYQPKIELSSFRPEKIHFHLLFN